MREKIIQDAEEYVEKLISTGKPYKVINPMEYQEEFCRKQQELIMNDVKERLAKFDKECMVESP